MSANRVKRALLLEKAPFLLGILLAGLAWTLNRIVEQVTDAPVLSAVKRDCTVTPSCVRFDVENISRSVLFKDVLLVLRIPSTDSAKIDSVFHAHSASTPIMPAHFRVSDSLLRDDASLTLAFFHPGGRITLTAFLSKPSPHIQLVASSSAQAVRLEGHVVPIFLVKNELALLLVLAALLTLIILMHIVLAAGEPAVASVRTGNGGPRYAPTPAAYPGEFRDRSGLPVAEPTARAATGDSERTGRRNPNPGHTNIVVRPE